MPESSRIKVRKFLVLLRGDASHPFYWAPDVPPRVARSQQSLFWAVRVVGVKILQHGQAFIDIDPVTPQDLPLARTVAPVPATATRLACAGE